MLKDLVLGVVRRVVGAANTIEDVLAVLSSVRLRRVASLEAESVSAHEVVPFNCLNRRSSPCGREHDTTHRITTEVGTMRVHFTTIVTGLHIYLGLVNEPDDLNVVRGLQVLQTSNGFSRNETCAVARLGAPSDHFAFNVTNGFSWFVRSPKTKIVGAIDIRGLAKRLLILGGRVANVVTDLGTTNKSCVGIDFVGKVSRRRIAF